MAQRGWHIVGQVGNLPPIINRLASGARRLSKRKKLKETSNGRFANRRQVANLPYNNNRKEHSAHCASIIIGAAHVVPTLAAYQLALQLHQPRIAARTKEHRLIVA
jgi:hypothetical protein